MKKVFRSSSLLLFFVFLFVSASAQKNNWPNTLLWKISGNGLTKPSYLFGTMHLQDKRIFNLGDSFYHHFERAEGFAIEVDFREYMDSLLTKGFQMAEDKNLRDEEEYSETVVDCTSVIQKPPPPSADMPAVKSDADKKMSRNLRKEFRKMRNEQIKSLLLHGRMPTILDAYLYGMAMKQGKWLGAVEELNDQLSIRDELGKDIDETEEMKQPERILLTSLGNMIKVYLAQDLNQIEEIALNQQSAKTKTIVFNNRNLKMARSMDSLSHLRSMFYAVGAAHLPGDSGVILLLRQKGYTLTPVISTSTMAAEKYAAGLPSLAWYEVGQTDGLYKVDMPGIPSEYNLYGELVKMKVYVDVTTMNFFMAGHTIAQFGDDELESAFKNMGKSMGGKIINIKKFSRDEAKGVEGMVNNGSTSFRLQMLKKGNSAFFLMVGSSGSYKISNADADKFFYSFKAGETARSSTPSGWKEFSLPDKGVTVKMPAVPKRNKSFERQAEGSGWNFQVYDCTDPAAGLYYLFQVRDVRPVISWKGIHSTLNNSRKTY
ncbi:MAG: TraB/GumN family protein [Lewinellaceae bacterium]|nr:TraB/GumN family protein [Lewinellaceae bacterium]